MRSFEYFDGQLCLVYDIITASQEQALIEKIDAEMDRERTPILRYGWNYNPADKWVQDIPDWVKNPRGVDDCTDCTYDSISVHEYLPGRGIPPHVDSHAFGPEIYVLSLLGDSVLIINQNTEMTAQHVFEIPRRSLYILSGAVRDYYKHAIEPVKTRRYSIVYRTKKK